MAAKVRDSSFHQLPALPQTGEHFTKTIQASLQVFNDLFGEVVGLWQVIQVRQALVLEPGNIEAGLCRAR